MIRWIVIHTTENRCAPGVARSVARWFQGPMVVNGKPRPASAHYVIGPDELIQCVDPLQVAWHCGPKGNGSSIGIELAGRAAFSAEDWAKPAQASMLRDAARLVAGLCARFNLEPVHRDADALRAGIGGLTGHVDVTRGLGGTDHTDPGASFPWEMFCGLVVEALTPST